MPKKREEEIEPSLSQLLIVAVLLWLGIGTIALVIYWFW
jgi:hypothetical protein